MRGECGEKRAAGLKKWSGHDRRCRRIYGRRKIMGRNRRKATAAEQIQAIYEKEAEVRTYGTAQIAENRGRKMETPRSDGPIGEERRFFPF